MLYFWFYTRFINKAHKIERWKLNSYEYHMQGENLSVDDLYKVKNNSNFKQALKNKFQNRLRFLGSHYKFSPSAIQVESYSERLVKCSVKENELELTIEYCINYMNAFPSWSELYTVIKANSKHLVENKSKEKNKLDNEIIEAEYEFSLALKEKFIEVFGKDGFTRYIDYYTNKVVGWDADNVLGIKIDYTKSALFDWHCSYYNPKKVKEVYAKKLEFCKDKRVAFINTKDLPNVLKKNNMTKRW